MNTKKLFVWLLLFFLLLIVIAVVTARKTQEAGLEWLPNQNVNSEEDNQVQISSPRLPENQDHFETTPEVARLDSARQAPQKPTTTATQESEKPKSIVFAVPFTSQAPTGRWVDARFQDGCEEAAALMAIRWAEGKDLTQQEAEREILAISKYELDNFGGFHDTSADDTVERIFKGYFHFENAEARLGVTSKDIREELAEGNLVIVPVNGQKIGNPFYTPPGPIHHMLVIIGYDPATGEFITNDPGTRRGKSFRYFASVLENALQDYPTGHHLPARPGKTAMIVVRKE